MNLFLFLVARGGLDRRRSFLWGRQPLGPNFAHPIANIATVEREFLELRFFIFRSGDQAGPAFVSLLRPQLLPLNFNHHQEVIPSAQPCFVQIPRRALNIARAQNEIKRS